MDTFTKTLHSVLTGVRGLEDFSRVLVTCAVEDTLLCVARDYGHDYGVLLKKYAEAVVRRHASCSLLQKTTCGGTTKNGKACGKRAVLHGYCQQHAVEAAQRQAKLREREAIADAVNDPRTAQAAELDILCGGKKPPPAAAFIV